MRTPRPKLTTADLLRANIPRRYWEVSFDKVPETAPYRGAVQKYLTNLGQHLERGEGLFLTHPTNGTGKTALAALVAKRALRLGYRAYYTMSEVYKTAVVQNQMFDEAQTVYDRARDVELLVLDDFGKEHKGASGWIESELENLIRERVQQRKTTVLTANILPQAISTHFTEDLASLLREGCYILLIPGEDSGGKNWRDEHKLGVLK